MLMRWLRALNIHPHADLFVIIAGGLLGVSAALLWAAQGSLILAYPTGAYVNLRRRAAHDTTFLRKRER